MDGIKKIGEIDGIKLYYDEHVEENNFLMGRKSKDRNSGLMYMPYVPVIDSEEPKESKEQDFNEKLSNDDINFIVGSTEDIEKYKKALELYKKR
jgi:hypothetical protein